MQAKAADGSSCIEIFRSDLGRPAVSAWSTATSPRLNARQSPAKIYWRIRLLLSQTTRRPLLSIQRPPRLTWRQPGGSGRQPIGPHSISAPGARRRSTLPWLGEMPTCAAAEQAIETRTHKLEHETAKRTIGPRAREYSPRWLISSSPASFRKSKARPALNLRLVAAHPSLIQFDRLPLSHNSTRRGAPSRAFVKIPFSSPLDHAP
jgi:hypothetical protein